MLFDLQDLLDKPRAQDFEASQFRAASSYMLRHQTIHREDHNARSTYDLIIRFRGYFSDLFDALGLKMVVSDRDLTIALIPLESQARSRLPIDETILLLSLRDAYERGVAAFEIEEHGQVETTTMVLLERYETITGRQRPSWPRVKEILRAMYHRNLIAYGDEFPEESGLAIIIRPTIRDVTGEAYLERIEEFIAAQGYDDSSDLNIDPGANDSADPVEHEPEDISRDEASEQ